MKKGKEKRRKITFKKGEKGLQNASFWAINSKYFAPPAANLFVGGKIESQKKGGGNDQNAQYISLYFLYYSYDNNKL